MDNIIFIFKKDLNKKVEKSIILILKTLTIKRNDKLKLVLGIYLILNY